MSDRKLLDEIREARRQARRASFPRKVSRLDRFRAEILYLRNHEKLSLRELVIWLRVFHRISVYRRTVSRWLHRHDSSLDLALLSSEMRAELSEQAEECRQRKGEEHSRNMGKRKRRALHRMKESMIRMRREGASITEIQLWLRTQKRIRISRDTVHRIVQSEQRASEF